MALHEADREDLFAEATALTTRIELESLDASETIVAGCRATGAWSIYFGAEPCYHFDLEGRLRRAFVDGRLYRTQGTTLARLLRVRTDDAVELQRTDLTPAERCVFLERTQQRLQELQQALAAGTAMSLRRFPEDVDVAALLQSFLERMLSDGPRLAPAIPTRSR